MARREFSVGVTAEGATTCQTRSAARVRSSTVSIGTGRETMLEILPRACSTVHTRVRCTAEGDWHFCYFWPASICAAITPLQIRVPSSSVSPGRSWTTATSPYDWSSC